MEPTAVNGRHSADMPVGSGRSRRPWSRWWLVVAACLVASLMPASGAGAAEDLASADDWASDAEAQREAGPCDWAGGVEVVRYAGSDAYVLSIELAKALVEAAGGTSEWVVLASGESWTDVVTAGPLAASLGAPVVLVPPGRLQTPTARPDLVPFLRSTGARRVVIVGSPEVLPNHEPSVLYGLGMLPRNIERLHGTDPVGNSIAVAKRIGAPAVMGDLGRTVIISSDRSVADAVAVGPLAAAGPFPLLLTAPDALDPRIAAYLTEHEVTHVVLVGGAAAIAPEVQEAIETVGVTATRLAGQDRIETANLAADLFGQHTADAPACADGPVRFGLAPAQDPEHALGAGPLLAHHCAPLRYTNPATLPDQLHSELFFAQSRTGGAELYVFESAAMLSDEALDITRPPVRIAAWRLTPGQNRAESNAVIVVADGHDEPRRYSETSVTVPTPIESQTSPWPTWDPQGRFLAYRSLADESLFILDTVSGELDQARFGAVVPRVLQHTGFSWSPDGSRLIFSGVIDDDSTMTDYHERLDPPQLTAELFLFDISTKQVSRLTHNRYTDQPESWSPDGSKIFYSSSPYPEALEPSIEGGFLQVWDGDVNESRFLSAGYFGGGRWSPDGSRVLFVGLPDDGWPQYSRELFAIDADGSRLEQLTPSDCSDCLSPRYADQAVRPHAVNDPRWSPSGDRVLYWVWVRTPEWVEASYLLHDFNAGRSRILLPLGPDDLAETAYFLGWLSDDELLFRFNGSCQDEASPRKSSRVVTINATTGTTENIFEIPFGPAINSRVCPARISLTPDREHLAASRFGAGLAVYSSATQTWSTVLESWESVGGPGTSVDGNCFFRWRDIGILGQCGHIRDVQPACRFVSFRTSPVGAGNSAVVVDLPR